jgi:hypothetical protein
MGNAVRHGRWDAGAIPPEVTPPTAPPRGTEECGRSTAWRAFPRPLTPLYHLRRWLLPACTGRVDFGPRRELTFARSEPYITANSARRRLGATARLRSSSLIVVTRLPITIGGPRLRRLSGSPEGGTALVPGCLTGESEERETWTAESLRTASRSEQRVFEGSGRTRLRRSTFQVNTLSSEAALCAVQIVRRPTRLDRSGTSSNVVIGREKFSSNLRV